MLSTDLSTLLMLFVCFLCVCLVGWAWIITWRASNSAVQLAEWADNVETFMRDQLVGEPTAAWKAEIDAAIAELRDSSASLGGSLRRLNGRMAARERWHKEKNADDEIIPAGETFPTDKDKLRQQAKQKGLL